MDASVRSGRTALLAGLLAVAVGLVAGPAGADFRTPGDDYSTFTDEEARQLEGESVPGTIIDIDDGGALGGLPSSVAAADFNGDGQDDLAASIGRNRFGAEEAWTFSEGVVVLLSQPDGSYSRPVYYPLGVEERSYHTGPVPIQVAEVGERGAADVAAADLNGDARPDLAVVNNRSDSVSVLLNNVNTGTGSVMAADWAVGPFAAPVRYATGSRPVAVAAADLDGANLADDGAATTVDDVEGAADLVVANKGDDTVTVLRNDGAGTYHLSTSTYDVGSSPGGVALADLDGQNGLDVVTANRGGDTVAVLFNNGDDTFPTNGGTSTTVGTSPRGVAAGDVDGDGDQDVATANVGSDDVSVLVNDGSGGLSAEADSPYVVGTDPVDVALADLGGTSHPDLAVANQGSEAVSVLRNDPATSPRFQPEATSPYPVGGAPNSVAVGNFDRDTGVLNPGDVDPDLATANSTAASLTVLHNQ